MKSEILKITENRALTKDIYKMSLFGAEKPLPGNFLELTVPGCFLNRPFGVAGYSDGTTEIYYRVLGEGTKKMTEMPVGTEVHALTWLGNSFDMTGVKRPLIVSGGLGFAPLKYLAECFEERGISPVFVAGFKNSADVVRFGGVFERLPVAVATDDGSSGYHGNVVDYVKEHAVEYDRYYACGPMPMLKGMAAAFKGGQLSLEARMGCGFGACMGCSIQTVSGPKRVCKEGPVFYSEEVIFGDR